MNFVRRHLAAALPLLLVALSGCTSQWYLQFETSDLVTTDVVVRTVPEGATISVDGATQAKSPVRIPIEYDHIEQLWSRQANKLLLFHYREDLRRHVYGHNKHVITAILRGHEDAEREIVLEGEDEVIVEIPLASR